MKDKKILPTTVEKRMRPGDFIVSKTDTKGRITYGNPIFWEFSGFAEEEALGVQHNLIRHPDMPRSVFRLLWETIQQGKECFAYVKNMSKDGSFYWVFANITPDFDLHGQITGFYSVRRTPRPEAIRIIEPVYREMLYAEQQARGENAIAAGTKVLVDILNSKGVSYDELVLSI